MSKKHFWKNHLFRELQPLLSFLDNVPQKLSYFPAFKDPSTVYDYHIFQKNDSRRNHNACLKRHFVHKVLGHVQDCFQVLEQESSWHADNPGSHY